jgi:tRNA(fMet)-specific endonuclease VapC
VIRPRYMLDTNTVSHVVKQHPNVVRHMVGVPMASLCISTITAGEMLYGLARRPDALRLRSVVTEFIRRVDVLPWDFSAAERYGMVRAALETAGKPLGSLDMLIAAHALAAGAVLVTNDHAFDRITQLQFEDWSLE